MAARPQSAISGLARQPGDTWDGKVAERMPACLFFYSIHFSSPRLPWPHSRPHFQISALRSGWHRFSIGLPQGCNRFLRADQVPKMRHFPAFFSPHEVSKLPRDEYLPARGHYAGCVAFRPGPVPRLENLNFHFLFPDLQSLSLESAFLSATWRRFNRHGTGRQIQALFFGCDHLLYALAQ